jgi:signal transduction histidine kinase
MRIDPRELNKVADVPDHRVEYRLFDQSDGLQPESLMWQSGVGGVRDTSGRLWLVNGQGMMVIDPAAVRDPRRPALPRLEAVTVNGDPVTPSADLELPNRAALEIEYAVLDLSAASKLRFRHLLDGVDAGWVYDGENRTAAYANLPAGDYRFRVSTTHNGQWTEAASWSFSVAPPLYLSRWFLAAATALLAAAIGAAIWLRVRAVEARYALVAAERARMSREIHDTLLQSLAALGPELEALAVRAGPANGTVARELRRVRREVSRSVREARDSILELRRHAMGAPPLAESLAELAEATARRHGLRPNVSVTGRRPDRAAPEVDAQLIQVAREAVSNAVRHGQPTRVDIAVAYDDGHVTLTVRDDGTGFRPEDEAVFPGEDGHFGIVTMRERVEKIGGELRIESAPGQGAMVQAAARVTSEWV